MSALLDIIRSISKANSHVSICCHFILFILPFQCPVQPFHCFNANGPPIKKSSRLYPSKSVRVVFLPRSFALPSPHPYPTPLLLNKSRPSGTWWSQEESMLAVSMAFIFQATAMELLCSNRVLILNVPLAFSQCSICLAGSKRRQSCCCGRLYFRHFRSNLVSWRIKPIDSDYRLLTMFG